MLELTVRVQKCSGRFNGSACKCGGVPCALIDKKDPYSRGKLDFHVEDGNGYGSSTIYQNEDTIAFLC